MAIDIDGNEPTDVSSANYIYLVLHPYLAPTSSTHLYRNIIFVTTTITWVKLPYSDDCRGGHPSRMNTSITNKMVNMSGKAVLFSPQYGDI